MEATKCLKPSGSGSRIGDRASVQAATRVNAEQASHEGGTVKVAVIDGARQSGKTPYCLIGGCSRDVERCLTNRALNASLVLRPSRSSFSVSLIKAY